MNGSKNRQSLHIGTYSGIKLRVHISWIIIFLLVAWSVISGYLPIYYPSLPTSQRMIYGTIVTILFFVSVIVHEFAHALLAKRRGLKIDQITLFLFGGAAELQQEPNDARSEFMITAAGPATSYVIAVILGAVWLAARQFNLLGLEVIAGIVALLNIVVATFNLLPAYPLDGGRILRSLIWIKTKDMLKATKDATRVSSVLAYLMIAAGLIEIFYGAFLGGVWMVFLGYFLHQMAQFSYKQTLNQQLLGSLKVSDIMETGIITVSANTTVDDYLNSYVLRYRQYDFLVTLNNKVVGIVSADRVSRLSGEARQESVENHMLALGPGLKLRPSDGAVKALDIMLRSKIQVLPVFSMRKLVGSVSMGYINDFLRLNQTTKTLSQPAQG